MGVGDPSRALSILAGAGSHTAWMIGWALCFAAFSHRKQWTTAVVSAILVAAIALLTSRSLSPAAMGAVQDAGLPAVQATLCVVLMAGGFLVSRAIAGDD